MTEIEKLDLQQKIVGCFVECWDFSTSSNITVILNPKTLQEILQKLLAAVRTKD